MAIKNEIETKKKSTIDMMLEMPSSVLNKPKFIKSLMEESKGDLNYVFKDDWRLIDLLILTHLDYNGIGHSKAKIKSFLETNGKTLINIIEQDVSDKNPLALIISQRTSSLLMEELIKMMDFSEKNIELKPGLKKLFNSLSVVVTNYQKNSSDFLLQFEKALESQKHLDVFFNKVKVAYGVTHMGNQQ